MAGIVIAHVSDVHLDGGERNAQRAQRVFAYLNNLRRPITAVLVTGDITDHGTTEEYEQARAELVSRYPVLMCPGNHDDRVAYRRTLLGESGPDHKLDAPINETHRIGDVTFAMCDSSIPGENSGYLSDDTLEWLDGVLRETPAGTRAFVCFHHPPVELHSPFVDRIRQHGERRLATMIERHRHVVALLCGHAHTAGVTTFAGRPLLVAPGVVSTLRLPWEREDVLDYSLPPVIAFHILGTDGRLTTHYRVVL